jgi:hypothetical protein
MAEVTQSEVSFARIRGSQEDAKRILAALDADKSITVVPDDPPEEPEALLDDEGNEVKDEEGNVVLQAPEAVSPSPVIEIEVENEEEEEEPEAEAS